MKKNKLKKFLTIPLNYDIIYMYQVIQNNLKGRDQHEKEK